MIIFQMTFFCEEMWHCINDFFYNKIGVAACVYGANN